MQGIQFDYFHGMEADQYSFYRIPKILFTAERFKSLSCEAKVLYGLMLDRMSLSIKNHWYDEEDRVYIIFTVEEVMELMGCKTQKATKLLKELDTKEGIGLIEKKRMGLRKPNVIYVKNFMVRETIQEPKRQDGDSDDTSVQDTAGSGDSCTIAQNFENQKSEITKIEEPEFPESKIQNFENQKSGISEIESPEFPESKIQNFENQKSGILKIENQEFPKSKTNNTDIIKTDYSETDYSETNYSETDSISSYPISRQAQEVERGVDVIEQMDNYREFIRKRIFYYERYGNGQSHERKDVDELVELIVEVLLQPDSSSVRIAGIDKPVAIVKSRFMQLDQSHIEYVIFCLQRNTTKVGNIKAYLLTTLYNATMTMNNYYQVEVNHDMYGGG